MYALVIDNTITKYFSYPKGFTLGDNQYPADIFMKWSVEEKEAIGIYEVVFDDSNKKDEKWYINTNQSFAFADGVLQLLMVLLLQRLMQILHGRKMMKMMEIYQMTNQLEILKLED
jgi:hypothetical protein